MSEEKFDNEVPKLIKMKRKGLNKLQFDVLDQLFIVDEMNDIYNKSRSIKNLTNKIWMFI